MVYCKRLIILSLIFIIFFSNYSFATSVDPTNMDYSDNYMNLYEDYNSIVIDFLNRLTKALNSTTTANRETAESIIELMNNGYFIYPYRYNSTNNYGDDMISQRIYRPRYLGFIIYRNVSSTTPYSTGSRTYYDGTKISCEFYIVGSTYSYTGSFDNNNPTLSQQSGTNQNQFTIPQKLIAYNTQIVFDYLQNYYGNGQNLAQMETYMNNLLQQAMATDDEVRETKEEVQNMNDFLQNQNVDNSSTQLQVEDTIDFDYTDNINTLFDLIENAFTGEENTEHTFIFTIPFTNSQMTFSSQQLRSMTHIQTLTTLFSLFWYYIFGKAILIDIMKIVESITSGDFLKNKTDTLITVDML